MDEAWFRARYDADAANKAKQSWEEHWKWIRRFYEGQSFPPVQGWPRREHDILHHLHADGRAAVAPRLSAVGRRLASEWSKDNAVRKVSTGDLQMWGKRFQDARDLAALEKELAHVEAELTKRGVA